MHNDQTDNIKNIENNKKHINLKSIVYDSMCKNKEILLSFIVILVAYWAQDVVFFGKFSKFTSNVPKFIENINLQTVMSIIIPYTISELLFYLNNTIVSYTIPKIELDIIQKLTQETLESIQSAKTKINTNEYIMNLKKVLESKSVYYLLVTNIVPTILVAIGIIYYFVSSNTNMGIVILLILMVFACIVISLLEKSIEMTHINESTIGNYYDNIQDVIVNSDIVMTSNTKNQENENLAKNKNIVYQNYLSSELESTENSFSLRLLSLVTVIILDAIAIYMYTIGKMNVETVTSICLLSVIFLKYFNTFVGRFRNTVGYIGKFNEIDEYFSQFEIVDNKSQNNLKVTEGEIEFSKINLTYNNRTILENFNFKIKGNTKVCIIGNIGSGKTSLLKMICNLIEYDGNIFVDKQNLKNCTHESIIDEIAYIPQHPKMFNKTILYNIKYGTNKTDEEVAKLIKDMELEKFYTLFSHNLTSSVGKEGYKLSGGQKQLIAITRALLQNKKIILLDEPTSSLDSLTKSHIVNLLKKIKNKTLLVVTHDKTILDIFDESIVIK